MHNLENVDYVGEWYYRRTLGMENVINDYYSKGGVISTQAIDHIDERMASNINTKLLTILNADNDYVFFFPPYSILFWYDAYSKGYGEAFLKAKQAIVDAFASYPNVEIYDFQATDYVMDLDNYVDGVHYRKEMNDLMVECFADGHYKTNSDLCKKNKEKLEIMVENFMLHNSEWLLPWGE